MCFVIEVPLQWRHNERDGVSNHQPHDCLLNRLFGRRSKKTSKLCVTGLCAGNSPGPVNSPHKGTVTRKCFHLMTSSFFTKTSILCHFLFLSCTPLSTIIRLFSFGRYCNNHYWKGLSSRTFRFGRVCFLITSIRDLQLTEKESTLMRYFNHSN